MSYKLFKTTYKGRDGTRRESPRWHIRAQDHDGVWRRVSGFTDKGMTDRRARMLEALATRRAENKPLTPALLRWLDGLLASLAIRPAGHSPLPTFPPMLVTVRRTKAIDATWHESCETASCAPKSKLATRSGGTPASPSATSSDRLAAGAP